MTGQDKLADVCVRASYRDTIKSTAIKSNLVTVQRTQLTVWKLLGAFFLSFAYFGPREAIPPVKQFPFVCVCVCVKLATHINSKLISLCCSAAEV